MKQLTTLPVAIAALFAVIVFAFFAFADSASIDFESYTLGTVNGQDGWSALGSVGSGCAVYDVEVGSSFGVPGFGSKSLRISNAVTSGCFGDQTFSKSLVDEAGETDAQNGGMSGGTRQNHFEAQFDIRAMQLSQQPGLFLSVSPDRGDGARMSYLGFEDTPGGIDVIFYDVQGTDNPANFVPTTVATGLSRAVTHTAKFVIDFVDGPSNDVVEIYIDDVLVHTGTTWENYFRFDDESNPGLVNESRTVDSLLFMARGAAAPATLGEGYLIDNVSLSSSTVAPPPDVTVTIVKYVDGVHATAGNAEGLSFPMDANWDAANIGAGSGSFALSTVGFNNPNPYEATTADMTNGADYSAEEDLTGPTVGASCAEGKPFALVGYTTGENELDAAGGTPTLTPPSLTGITDDAYIIVWNEKCATTLTLEKVVVNDNGGTSLDTDWTLSASGPSPISGVEGGASVTNAEVTPGTYDLSEAGPAGYTASAWVCTGGTQDDDDTVTIAAGEHVTCTIINDDEEVLPPAEPPANACETPGVAPAGFTLLEGTPGSDNVTIAPFTMFVGKGGNDWVKGPASGNYIVCTGAGSDLIRLGDGDFTISADGGNNDIETGNGDGYIKTGSGGDRIITGSGVATIEAGGGNNNIRTGDGAKTITAGSGNDNITTGAGNDVINADGGTNRVSSGAGDDTITAGNGNDTVDAGADSDTCNVGGGFNTVKNCAP